MPDGQQVSGQDISLDHPVNQQTQLKINGAEIYQQNFATAALSFYQDNRYLFGTSADSFDFYPPRIPTSVPAIALTAPFDTTRAAFSLNVGASYELPSGQASARVPVENLSSVTLSLPKPMALTSPVLGTWHEPGPASLRGLVFQWRADTAAQMVEFTISPDADNMFGQIGWTVTGPGSVSSFKPFSLPVGDRAYTSPITMGKYRISLSSRFNAAISHYADFFTQKPASDPLAPQWWTRLDGAVEFQ